MDPLAEEFPVWTPYHYVHNNPINLVDPTGMVREVKDDWVHYKGSNGKNQFIYDKGISTVEQVEAKGYNNIQSVSSSIYLNSGTESYMLSENATVTDMTANKTVNTGFNLADGSYIGGNNILKSSAEEAITRGVLFYLGSKLRKVGSSQLENRMNEGLIDAFDKTYIMQEIRK
ncbi:hypothetical protein [Myroides odoratus]|uniref:hypothetical protein n=1 Tax=Myroides odoratus TaxID=256 RepID=UPI003341D063